VQILAEARIRLVSGLKKYFHGKRAEGLLSARGIQVLDFMCDLQMDLAHEPLFMWSLTETYALLPLPPPPSISPSAQAPRNAQQLTIPKDVPPRDRKHAGKKGLCA